MLNFNKSVASGIRVPFCVLMLSFFTACDSPTGGERIRPGKPRSSQSGGPNNTDSSDKPGQSNSCRTQGLFDLHAWSEKFRQSNDEDETQAIFFLTELTMDIETENDSAQPLRILQQELLDHQLSMVEGTKVEVFAQVPLIQTVDSIECKSITFITPSHGSVGTHLKGFDIDRSRSNASRLILTTPKGERRIYEKVSDSVMKIQTEEPHIRTTCNQTLRLKIQRNFRLSKDTKDQSEPKISSSLARLLNVSLGEDLEVDGETSETSLSELKSMNQILLTNKTRALEGRPFSGFTMIPCNSEPTVSE